MQSFSATLVSPYTWIAAFFTCLVLLIISLILLFLISKWTHATMELKARFKRRPIALFFEESRYCTWKPVVEDCGLVDDKNYGTFIVNPKATYIDSKTKNILLPFDASFGVGMNMHSAKLADDLQYIVKDEEELRKLRFAIANNMIDESEPIVGLRTTIYVGALKTMLNAIIPHNINAKIEKAIAARMKGYGKIDTMQIIIIFAAILGACLMGYLIIKVAVPH